MNKYGHHQVLKRIAVWFIYISTANVNLSTNLRSENLSVITDMCDHTYKCVILVKSNIFFTLCQTSFLNSTKCDFNTFLIKHYYVHQNVWVLLKCRGHCLRIVLLNFTRITATQILNLNISPPPTPTKIYNHYVEVCFLPLHASEQHWFIGWVRGQVIEG